MASLSCPSRLWSSIIGRHGAFEQVNLRETRTSAAMGPQEGAHGIFVGQEPIEVDAVADLPTPLTPRTSHPSLPGRPSILGISAASQAKASSYRPYRIIYRYGLCERLGVTLLDCRNTA